MKTIGALLVLLLFLPTGPALGFSEIFQKKMTVFQAKILMKGQPFTREKIERSWRLFDDEAVRLLGTSRDPEALNREGARQELSLIDREERLELGTVEVGFLRLSEEGSADWVVSYQVSGVGPKSASTFRVFRCGPSTCRRAASLEAEGGPWDPERIFWSQIQLQGIRLESPRRWRFTSYHLPSGFSGGLSGRRKTGNRSQIVWEYDGADLRPLLWVPEVDWHLEAGARISGRGASHEIP